MDFGDKDIMSEGMWMIGGCARLRGLSERLGSRLNLRVNTVDDPFHLIAGGALCKYPAKL